VTVFQQDMMKDRAIFLTGGGTGLGRSMALHFAMLGARMFLVGRREQPLQDVCDEIQRGGGSAAFATCDVRDYGAVETAANLAYEKFGRIDTLINNAAGNFMARTENLTPNAFNAVVGIVLNAHLTARRFSAKDGSPRNSVATC
jgi:NAD(P)-dependent dehydrogenase (short-subunit alcohol dehydrogenase family)